MRIRLTLLGAFLAVLTVANVSASNDTLADYTYVMTVGVNNQSGGAFANRPIAVQMQPDNLVPVFLQADADDWRPVNADETALTGVAQGMTSGAQTWWFTIPAQGSGAVANYYFHMGNTTATRDQSFGFDGTTDTVTATDHADLDITDDLGMLVDFNLYAWPASATYLLQKLSAYDVGVRTTGGNEEIFASIFYSTSVTLIPNAAGDFENIANRTGCAAASHWQCVDVDDANKTLEIDALPDNTLQDAYNLTAFGTITTEVVTSVTIVCKQTGQRSGGTPNRVALRLGGTTGTFQNTTARTGVGLFTEACNGLTAFTRPGGGAWVGTDLDDLQVVTEITEFNDTVTQVGFLYVAVTVAYDVAQEVATTTEQGGASLVAGTTYRVSATYDNDLGSNQLRLYVNDSDDVAEANATRTADIATNTSNLILGTSVNGNVTEAGVANVAAEEPTAVQFVTQYEFEPDDLAETQKGTSANTWTWLGTVEDISTGGVDHDGSYSLTRNMASITTWTYDLHNKTATVMIVAPGQSDLLGAVAPVPQATKAGETFPFRSTLTNVLEDPNYGISTIAAWFVLFMVLGIGLSVLLFKLFNSNMFAAMGLPAMLWVGWLVGSPIPWWIPLVFSLAIFGLATGGKKLANA